MQTAFALTIHKSQGSEFTHTAIVLMPRREVTKSGTDLYRSDARQKVVSILADSGTLQQALIIRTVRRSGLVQKINFTGL